MPRSPPLPAELTYNTDTATSREYAVPDVTKSAFINGLNNTIQPPNGFETNVYHDESPPPPPPPPHPRAMFGATDTLSMQVSLENFSVFSPKYV